MGAWPFYREWGVGGQNEYTWNGVPIRVSKFCLKKAHTRWIKPKNQFLGHIFPHISGSIGSIVFKNNRVHTCVGPHQPCEFHENQLKTATCIVPVIIIISWKSGNIIFECKLKNIHKVLLLENYSFERKFYEDKLCSYQIFAKCITFWKIREWM